MSEAEAASVKARIINEGRSPTLIVKCENNHELLITLYNLRDGEGLGVRDIVVPQRSDNMDSTVIYPAEEQSAERVALLTGI
ncbi:MAG: hypothetical protein ACFFFK_11810, partial [Candidatus Thorarchaeota archaeon]